jgi:hypothetical protein
MGGITVDNVAEEEIHELTASRDFAPLEKQQRIGQWEYFGRVIPALVKALGASIPKVTERQKELFGVNALRPLKGPFKPPKTA